MNIEATNSEIPKDVPATTEKEKSSFPKPLKNAPHLRRNQ
jgi:hypothetical protein